MRIDYESIGALADEIGCSREDLIALSPDNDPFYVQRPGRVAEAQWFAGLWESLGFKSGSHLRRLHYTIISQDKPILKPNGEPYRNTHNDWKNLNTASLSARYLRLIPDGALADHRNDPPIINASNSGTHQPWVHVAGGYQADLAYHAPTNQVWPPCLLGGDLTVAQPYLLEVWVEKSTQNDILVPLARRLEFNLVSGTGETSEILARQAVERAISDGRPMRILYVSDFDPGGRSMPVGLARKIEFWISKADIDLDVTLDPIVLTPEQCEQYRLPRTPLKKTERRAAKFEKRFGEGATELDALEALHPGELARIVENEVCRYIDMTLPSRVAEVNFRHWREIRRVEGEVLKNYDIADIQRRYDELKDAFKAGAEALEEETQELWPQIAEDLEAIIPAFDPEDMPEPRPASPPDAPLFDSSRSYLDQIDAYRRWQGRGGTK
ncbi:MULTISPECIES: hypothetical protein [Rhizobium]|uniref:hypothetical protein n=1 Tax=Rhizobium TaxID=379 RepID=UPI001030C206|nr:MULTISPECIES: hypothetical protein [Rhizobium]MBY5483254.1 hypothetical protein [Rhizobium leguminosarum]NEI28474.1 hypothetical protein [Rhizobium ruizarguesonis]NKL64997.1 hypothetical protein [Rhizobium leguminosarum bv. viciae]TAW56556.1 hypothetical protein ELI17_09550 [Rhizobium ruizarguesonis]TBA16324.1 hypothetical protein ELH65_10350 [Rhizobium ruizarguesonis]